MTEMKTHPAVFAGLMGGSAMSVPTLAFAAPLGGIAETVASSLLLQFVLGCTAGAAVAGSIAFVAERIYVHKESDNATDEAIQDVVLDKNDWNYSSVKLVRGLSPDLDDDASNGIDPYHVAESVGNEPADIESTDDEDVDDAIASEVTTVVKRPRHFRAPRHLETEVTVRLVTQDAVKRKGRHFATAHESESLTVSIVSAPEIELKRGRHFAPSFEQVQSEASAPAIEYAPTEKLVSQRPVVVVSEVEATHAEYAPTEQLVAELPATVVSEAEVAHTDEAAPEVTQRIGLRERMSAGTRNVRKALAARLEYFSALDDIPIIKRGDGSAMEVAPSRLSQAIAPVIETITSGLEDTSDTAPMNERQSSEAAMPSKTSEGSDRAAYISRHVSEVEIGLFPERRSIEELEKNDMWEEALVAMGETLGQTTPVVFKDAIGGPSTIDEPDGLEGPTESIEFRVPVSSSNEVVTHTYVDYLLRDELSHSDAEVIRRSPHAHLRVIEGGTGTMRVRRRSNETGAYARTGRHYAPLSLAREA